MRRDRKEVRKVRRSYVTQTPAHLSAWIFTCTPLNSLNSGFPPTCTCAVSVLNPVRVLVVDARGYRVGASWGHGSCLRQTDEYPRNYCGHLPQVVLVYGFRFYVLKVAKKPV